MAGEMFGSPVGRSIAERDIAQEAMLGPKMLESLMTSAAVPGQMAQRAAQTRLLNTKADTLELDADVQRRVAAAAANMDWTDENKKNPVWAFANLHREAGDIKGAIAIAGKAATIDQKQASAATNAVRADLIQTRTALAELDKLGRQASTVNSPESLQALLQQHPDAQTFLDPQGNLLPQVAEQWETVKQGIIDQSMSAKDRIAADYRERALKSANQERTSRQDARKFWQDTDNQRKIAEAKAAGRVGKAGTDPLSKNEGMKMATDYVLSQYGIRDVEQARVLGADIADRAKQARAQNPALTPQEAIKLATSNMELEGKFEGLAKTPRNVNPSRPLPLPLDRDKTKLKVGQYYNDGKNTRQWLGPDKGFGGPITSGKIRAASFQDTSEEDDDAEPDADEDEDELMALED